MLLTFTAGSWMPIAAKLDELGKPAWIALMVLGFIVFWPLGLVVLAFLIWSGRMGCGRHMRRWREESLGQAGTWWQPARPSGNRAFDEYRAEPLRRLGGGKGGVKAFFQ